MTINTRAHNYATICLICIGDELEARHTLEKNSTLARKFLISKGLQLGKVIVSPDSMEILSRTLKNLLKITMSS